MVRREDRRLLIGLWRSKTLYPVIIGRKADTSTQWVRLILLANLLEHRVRRARGWNPSVSDISRKFVRQRLEMHRAPNPYPSAQESDNLPERPAFSEKRPLASLGG